MHITKGTYARSVAAVSLPPPLAFPGNPDVASNVLGVTKNALSDVSDVMSEDGKQKDGCFVFGDSFSQILQLLMFMPQTIKSATMMNDLSIYKKINNKRGDEDPDSNVGVNEADGCIPSDSPCWPWSNCCSGSCSFRRWWLGVVCKTIS